MMFKAGLKVYRETLKRSKALHRLAYGVTRRGVVPILESAKRFRTVSDDPVSFRLKMLTERYETETVEAIRRWTRPGMTVIDIGAHVGYYSRILAKLCGPQGHVLAFEPHPQLFKILKQNTHSFSNVIPVNAALADNQGQMILHDYLPGSGGSSLAFDPAARGWYQKELKGELAPRVRGGLRENRYTVNVRTLDNYLAQEQGGLPDLIKIDIEGAERAALEGMRRTLSTADNLVLVTEVCPKALSLFGSSGRDYLEALSALSFRFEAYLDGAWRRAGLKRLFEVMSPLERSADLRRVNLLCVKGEPE